MGSISREHKIHVRKLKSTLRRTMMTTINISSLSTDFFSAGFLEACMSRG